jgi:toxin ParE1/3/4
MAKHELPYELSQEADKDLEDIFDYTADKFGVTQAVAYVESFDEIFNLLAQNPKMGRERSEIRPELRSFAKESHVVFYRILKDRIRIIRVLHASRDVIKFIPPRD